MSTVSTLVALPIKVVLAGKEHEFKRLSLSELFGAFEEAVQKDWMARVRSMAELMQGDDKIQFLSHHVSNPPSGKEVERLVVEKMNSISGITMALKMAHTPSGMQDELPDIAGLMLDKEGKNIIRELVGAVSGTSRADEEKESGAGDPLQKSKR